MRMVTARGMRALEHDTIERIGIPALVLMERAALAVVEALEGLLAGRKRAIFLCGTGNNGGDGLAAARLFFQRGGDCAIVIVGDPGALSAEARVQYGICRKLGIAVYPVQTHEHILALRSAIAGVDAVVDALLGIGLSRVVEGMLEQVISILSQSDKPVLAVDIASGIDADTGAVRGCAVHATCTVTFAYAKPGHLLFPGRSHTGRLMIADIGLGAGLVEPDGPEWIEPAWAMRHWGERALDAHKGQFGHALVVAGSRGMAGAAALATKAALRMGAGLVTAACPVSVLSVIQALAPEAMAAPLEEQDGAFSSGCEIDLRTALCAKDAVAIGPGMTQKPGCPMVVRTVMNAALPSVIDADALNILSRGKEMIAPVRGKAVLTPHLGEMARLCGCTIPEVANAPVEMATALSRELDVVVLLKGATTIIAGPNGELAFNTTGTPGMATGGCGDALTGMICALLARGMGCFEAACTAACVHGLAGERAAAEKGVHAMTSMDLVNHIADDIWPEKDGSVFAAKRSLFYEE